MKRASSDHKNRNHEQMSKHPKATRQSDPLKEQQNFQFSVSQPQGNRESGRRAEVLLKAKCNANSEWIAAARTNKKAATFGAVHRSKLNIDPYRHVRNETCAATQRKQRWQRCTMSQENTPIGS